MSDHGGKSTEWAFAKLWSEWNIATGLPLWAFAKLWSGWNIAIG